MPDVFTAQKESAEGPWEDTQLLSVNRGQGSLTPGGQPIRIPGEPRTNRQGCQHLTEMQALKSFLSCLFGMQNSCSRVNSVIKTNVY